MTTQPPPPQQPQQPPQQPPKPNRAALLLNGLVGGVMNKIMNRNPSGKLDIKNNKWMLFTLPLAFMTGAMGIIGGIAYAINSRRLEMGAEGALNEARMNQNPQAAEHFRQEVIKHNGGIKRGGLHVVAGLFGVIIPNMLFPAMMGPKPYHEDQDSTTIKSRSYYEQKQREREQRRQQGDNRQSSLLPSEQNGADGFQMDINGKSYHVRFDATPRHSADGNMNQLDRNALLARDGVAANSPTTSPSSPSQAAQLSFKTKPPSFTA